MKHTDKKPAQTKKTYGAATIRSSAAITAAKMIRYGLVFLVQAFLMNLLAPDEFGLMKYVTIILGVVNLITVAGLNTAIIQKKELGDNERGPLFVVNLFICLMLTCLIYAAAPLAAGFFGEAEAHRLTGLIRAGSFIVLIGGASTVHRSIMQREFRYGALSAIEAVSAIVSSAVSVTLAFKGYGAWVLCWSLLAFHFVSTALCVTTAPRGILSIKKWGGLAVALPLFWFGAGWTLLRLLDYLNTNLANLLIGGFFGTGALGAFTVAFEIVSVPQLGFGLVLVPVALSAFSRMQDDDRRMRDAYQKILLLTSMISTIYCVIIGFCASDLIKTITALKPNDRWDNSALFMRWLAPLGLMYSWSCCLGILWTAKRKITLQLTWSAVMILTSAAAIIIGARYGYLGVCAALLIRAVTMFPVQLIVTDRTTGIKPREYLGALAPSLVCGSAGAAACAGTIYALTEIVPAHHAIRLAACVFLSSMAYVATAAILYGGKLKMLKQYFRRTE